IQQAGMPALQLPLQLHGRRLQFKTLRNSHLSTSSELETQSSQSESFRLFVAVTVPPHVQQAIESAQTGLRRLLPSDVARWTKREQFHLTLRFLGNVDSRQVAELESKLRDACRSFQPMHLQAIGFGFFPEKRFPRVLWVGLHDQTNQI